MSFSVNKLNVLSLYLDEVHKVIYVISDTDVNNESKINYFTTVSFCISLSGDQQRKKNGLSCSLIDTQQSDNCL